MPRQIKKKARNLVRTNITWRAKSANSKDESQYGKPTRLSGRVRIDPAIAKQHEPEGCAHPAQNTNLIRDQLGDGLIVKVESVPNAIAQRIELTSTPFNDGEVFTVRHEQIMLLLGYDFHHGRPPSTENWGDPGSSAFLP